MIEQYVDTGKVRFVYREFPLTSIHPAAMQASEAAICAGMQGKYWEMNEHLFETVSEWSQGEPEAYLNSYAEELGLDMAAFEECLASDEGITVINEDLMAGEMAGVNATPYFFVNDIPVRGGMPIEVLGQIIDYVAAGGETPEIVPKPGDPRVMGDVQAVDAISVAFVDFASPESAEHALEVLPTLVSDYVDSGRYAYILHPWSESVDSPGFQAAVAAECAGVQGKYWEMHDEVFRTQGEWIESDDPGATFADRAATLELSAEEFVECMDSDWAKLRVQSGSVLAALYGVPGAPVFLFSDGSAQQGSPTLDEFKGILDGILSPGG